ncbi:DDE-domain-containing protein, partial [Parathielavia hyrcaniae]
GVSDNGWTTDELTFEWLQEVFEPQTRNRTVGQYRLLILDGHGSHLTPAFDKFCTEHRILTECMPPHSSHYLQPLDVRPEIDQEAKVTAWSTRVQLKAKGPVLCGIKEAILGFGRTCSPRQVLEGKDGPTGAADKMLCPRTAVEQSCSRRPRLRVRFSDSPKHCGSDHLQSHGRK